MLRLIRAVLLVALLAPFAAATPPAHAAFKETVLSDPQPSFDEPRRLMLQISTGDEREINNILWNAVNLQKYYGIDNVKIAVIAFGPGMVALYKDSPVRERIESLLKYGIEFIGCGNTMETTHRTPDDLIEGVDYVTAGLAEIVERQLDGWIYLKP